ncbi:hypothetical protein JYT84_00055 [bacterium AH-315-M10]|nr:hypothetical protein [bacterium AH-315-M10]
MLSVPVEAYLEQVFDSVEPANLREALRAAVRADVSRIRSRLMLEAARMLGLDPAPVIPAAAAVEMVHSAGRLMLDRDEPLAALSAISLVSRALWLTGVATVHAGASGEASRSALERLSEAIGLEGLAGGIAGELTEDPDWDWERVAEKTRGSLFAAAMGMVADLAGVVPAEAASLAEFGRRFGIAQGEARSVADPLAVLAGLGRRAQGLVALAKDYLESDGGG